MITDVQRKELIYFVIGMDAILVFMNIACLPSSESIIATIGIAAISLIFCELTWYLLGAKVLSEYKKDQEALIDGEAIEGQVIDIYEEEIGFHKPEKVPYYIYKADIRLIDGRVISTKSLNKRPQNGARSITHFYNDRVVTEIEDAEVEQSIQKGDVKYEQKNICIRTRKANTCQDRG